MSPLSVPHDEHGVELLAIARGTLEACFGGPQVARPDAAWLAEPKAVFVTITKHGQLRGCVGQLAAHLPLFDAVRTAAKAAAFEDARFAPLQAAELDEVQIEVSVLSPLESVAAEDEADLLEQLRPGVDGLVLTHGAASGVFIPEVWKQLPDKRQFVTHLKRKAGLPEHWLPGTRAQRFTAQCWEEP